MLLMQSAYYRLPTFLLNMSLFDQLQESLTTFFALCFNVVCQLEIGGQRSYWKVGLLSGFFKTTPSNIFTTLDLRTTASSSIGAIRMKGVVIF